MSEDLKEKILNKALDLFNKYGYESVKMRDISGALNISPGNLTYHYKKKDDIIYAIVEQQYRDHERRKCTEEMTFEEFNHLLKANVEHQKKYFFYFNNITELPRKYPEIAKIQIEVKRDFYILLKRFFKNLTMRGLMRPELIEGAYDDLAFAIISIVVFWTQETFIQNNFVSNSKTLLSVVWNIIRPNLTEKGIQLIPINENP